MALSPLLRKAVSTSVNKYSRSNTKTVKPKEGRNVYRILAPVSAPWVPESGQFWADLGVHWIKLDPNGKPIAVVGCADVCYQKECAIDTALDLAINAAIDDDSKKIFEEMRANKSVLFNAIDRSTPAEGVVILELKPSAAQQVLDLMLQYEDAGQDLFDLATGTDLVVTRSGKGFDTTYTVNVKPGASEPVPADTLAKCHDLHAYIEREFFKGEETKALNAISQASGVALPRLASGTRTPTQALTSPAVSVPDATPTKVETKTVIDSQAAEIEARRKAILAKQEQQAREAAAELAALEASIPAVTPTKTTEAETAAIDMTSALPDDQIDDVLAQLDNI